MRLGFALLVVSLVAVPLFGADDAKPPEGWKAFQHKTNAFSCWLPAEKGIERENFKDKSPMKGMTLRFASITYQPTNGPLYEAGTVTVMPYAGEFTKLKAVERVDILRNIFVEASGGKASGEKELKIGRVPGREFVIEGGNSVSKNRIYQYVDRFFFMAVTGTKEQVEAKNSTIFLDSYKIPDRYTGLGDKAKDK